MVDTLNNFAYGTVLTPPSPASTGYTLTLNSGQGSTFPTNAYLPYRVTIWPANTIPTASNAEIDVVTNISSDTLTLTESGGNRTPTEGTSAQSITAGYQVAQMITAHFISELLAAFDPAGSASAAQSAAETYAAAQAASAQSAAESYAQAQAASALASAETYALNAIQNSWPVGSIFFCASSTSPASLLGFGTWTQIAQGMSLFGYKSGDPNFGTLGGTGGAATTSSVVNHTHSFTSGTESAFHQHPITDPTHSHLYTLATGAGSAPGAAATGNGTFASGAPTASSATGISIQNEATLHTHSGTTGNPGGGQASIPILPPFLVVAIWQRTG